MGRAADRAGHNYYEPLRQLFGCDLKRKDLVESYRDEMRYLWHHLRWWLDEEHGGTIGLSTIVEDDHFTHIGFADSQTLFAASDRDKLSLFFSWAGLKPGQEVEADELLVYFKAWALRRDDLSLGAKVMLEGDTYPAQLARIVERAAQGWEGVVRDDEGRATAPVLLALTAFPPPAQLRLVARRPSGSPGSLSCRFRLATLELTDDGMEDGDGAGWYEVPLEPKAELLLNGVQLVSDSLLVNLPPSQIHVLQKNQEIGCWASVAQLAPGEPAWVLARERIADQVGQYLTEYAQSWRQVERSPLVPDGWRLFRDVVIDSAPAKPIEGLRRLVPRYENRLSLRGGLPLRGSDAYLSGGEPDLWLPPTLGGELSLRARLDGRDLDPQGETEMISLAREKPAAGDHEVNVGPIRRRFHSVRTLGSVRPRVERPIGRVLVGKGKDLRPAAGGAREQEAETEQGIFISGALIDGADESLPSEGEPPLVLPVGALRRTILGARPGQIDEPRSPARPRWMEEVGLQQQSFEYEPPFEPVWVLTEWRLDPPQRVRLRHSRPPISEPTSEPSAVAAWIDALLTFEPPVEEEAAALWHSYSDVAEETAR